MKLIAILLLSSMAFAADAAPKLTDAQRVTILTAERDYLLAQQQAQPYDEAAQKLYQELQTKEAAIVKELGVDTEKFQLNANSLEFAPVPQKAKPAATPDVKK